MAKAEKAKCTEYNDENEHAAYIKAYTDVDRPLANGRCFDNCYLAAIYNIINHKDWRYTEGVAVGHDGLLYYHAWLTSLKGKIWDITWGRFDSTKYYPRYIFNVEKLLDLAQDGQQKPFTRYIYKGHTKLKNAIIEEGVEHPDFDYTKWSTMGQPIQN